MGDYMLDLPFLGSGCGREVFGNSVRPIVVRMVLQNGVSATSWQGNWHHPEIRLTYDPLHSQRVQTRQP